MTTSLILAQDIDDKEVRLILPMSSQLGQQALMRYTDDPITQAAAFDAVDRSVYDQAVADALQDVNESDQAAQRKLAKAIGKAAGASARPSSRSPGRASSGSSTRAQPRRSPSANSS